MRAILKDENMVDVVNENYDETVKDKLKESGNEIDFASTVPDGMPIAKLSETAIPLNEGDAQGEDERGQMLLMRMRMKEIREMLRVQGPRVYSTISPLLSQQKHYYSLVAGNGYHLLCNSRLLNALISIKWKSFVSLGPRTGKVSLSWFWPFSSIGTVVMIMEIMLYLFELDSRARELKIGLEELGSNRDGGEQEQQRVEGVGNGRCGRKDCSMVDENEDKTVKDKPKELVNEIVSASTVSAGIAELGETAIPLKEDDTAQDENEKMAD
ncbi:unnamed protein product [Fraxinus pennsylvanica]|uniref:Uncharacterized protein n=1 Tax=Fraxinus pennsylvanica TaxID=56036 RepID=A0AAD1ZN51_9LAMI|nr:unnamed protein product [Fraxinus pennsylvanica]